MDADVIVAGGGLGGLCLAAGLRQAGLSVIVLERDADMTSRPQGYRININTAGRAALKACLPDRHFTAYVDTSHRQTDPSVDIFTPDLSRVLHRVADAEPDDAMPPSAVDRATLRAILCDAAGDVRFGGEVTGFETVDEAVHARSAAGKVLSASLLVAADGAGSLLRQQILPDHDPAPLGVVGIYGRAPLDIDNLTWMPRGVIEQRFVGLTDGEGLTLALGAWRPRGAAGAIANLPDVAPYLMWVLLDPADALPGAEADAATLHRYALDRIAGWAPEATQFVRDAIVADTFRVTLRAMPRIPDWPSGRVTFLGDAIHAMSPAGGEGANTAFVDAAALAAALRDHGVAGVAKYEADLRQRAQAALDRSASYSQTRGSDRP